MTEAGAPAPPRLFEPAETDGTVIQPEPRTAAARRDADHCIPLYTNVLLVQSTLPGKCPRCAHDSLDVR